MTARYEIKVGDRVRSYDFPGRRDSYVEGVVEAIDCIPGGSDCRRYHLRVRKLVASGEAVADSPLLGEVVYPPVNGTPTLGGRVCEGVEPLDLLDGRYSAPDPLAVGVEIERVQGGTGYRGSFGKIVEVSEDRVRVLWITGPSAGARPKQTWMARAAVRPCPVRAGYTERALDDAFKAVQAKTHWKDPIDARVTGDMVAVTVAAIEYYTATLATVTALEAPWYRVTSIGYRAGGAGDH